MDDNQITPITTTPTEHKHLPWLLGVIVLLIMVSVGVLMLTDSEPEAPAPAPQVPPEQTREQVVNERLEESAADKSPYEPSAEVGARLEASQAEDGQEMSEASVEAQP